MQTIGKKGFGMTTIKAKKDFLRTYRSLKREEKTIREEIAALELSAINISVGVGDGMPHSHDPKGLEEYIARKDQLERKLQGVLWECINQQILIEISINSLPNATERTILRQRYLLFKDWDIIADFVGYSRRQTLYIHGAALKNLEVVKHELS